MSVSDQIIAVLDDLCTKFGIAIDWTAENILPQVQDLCERYILFEIYTSVAWGVIMLAVTAIVLLFCGVFHRKAKEIKYDIDRFHSWAAVISWVLFGIMLFVTIMVFCNQVFDIIECCTIPEKVILEYIKGLISYATGG